MAMVLSVLGFCRCRDRHGAAGSVLGTLVDGSMVGIGGGPLGGNVPNEAAGGLWNVRRM